MKNTHLIFDLDGTVIDSTHRQRHVDGVLDLAHWRANATRENILRDTLLPLANLWRAVQDTHPVIVCTARNITSADVDFLSMHGLRYKALLSRPHGDGTPDPLLKVRLLEAMYRHIYTPTAGIFFDDRQDNLDAVASLGVTVKKA